MPVRDNIGFLSTKNKCLNLLGSVPGEQNFNVSYRSGDSTIATVSNSFVYSDNNFAATLTLSFINSNSYGAILYIDTNDYIDLSNYSTLFISSYLTINNKNLSTDTANTLHTASVYLVNENEAETKISNMTNGDTIIGPHYYDISSYTGKYKIRFHQDLNNVAYTSAISSKFEGTLTVTCVSLY